MNTDFNILVKKIDAFRKRYHLYQFLRGLILFLIVFVILFLLINLLEYQLYMPSAWRRIMFITSVIFLSLIFFRYVFFSVLQLSGILETLNYKKASHLIKGLLPDVKDKLINVLELHDNTETLYSSDITQAAISQKISELRVFDFSKAVSMKNIKTLMTYFAASFILVVIIHLFNSSLFFESGNRIIKYNQQFVKPSPYTFVWDNPVNGIQKGSSYTIKLKCEGTDIPSVMYLNIGGNNYLMNFSGSDVFEYEIVSLINPINFYFTDLKYLSENYLIDIIPVPVVNSFITEIEPPAYTSLSKLRMENVGDMQVPKGSIVKWIFDVYDTDSLIVIVNGKDTLITERENRNRFSVARRFLQPSMYEIKVRNQKTSYESIMNFRIDIIEDMFPEIKLTQITDSSRITRLYFRGSIHDDYGFSNLKFHVNIDVEDSSFTIPFNRYVMPQEFYYSVDLQDYNLKNQTINYYFSVTDNDGVNGPKTTTSESYSFHFPDRVELTEKQSEEFNKIEDLLKESQQIADELRNDLKELQLKNLNSNISDWEKSRLAEDLMNKKNDLEQVLEQIEKSYKNLNNYNNTFNEQSSEMLQKQQQIQDLLEDVLTDELKKLLEEFSELAREFNDQRLNELSKQMDLSFDDLSKQLDRNLQMLKKMKIEQNLQGVIDQVKEMEQKQADAAKDAAGNESLDELQNEMISDHQEMENVEQQLNQILEENEQLDKPINFDEFKNEFNEIKENIRNSLQELQQNNRRNSSKSMQDTSEKLKNMAFSMQQMLNMSTMQQNMENIQNLKQILKNLLVLSFDQEDVLRGVSTTSGSDPMVIRLTRKQRDLMTQSEVIKDSLYALARRAPQIGNVVNNELMSMSINLNRSSELMNEGLNSQALTNQQLVITATNNLALMLSEVLQQMEDMMNNPQDGEGDAQGGQGGKQMGMMKEQSENLRQQLQQMIDQMKNGNQPMSREMSESLMMHEMMQQMLREMMNSGTMGESARKQLQDIDRLLEQNRRDLMNKNVNPAMVRRQNEIMTRLLEAERSEMERDQDNKRESNTADEQFYSNPAQFFDFEPEKNITIENLQRNNLKLNNFYQNKFKNYVEKFNIDAP
jgi:hypothetical protein